MAAKQKAGAPSPSLSKGLMNLKFMQRQKEAELRKQLEAEQQKKAHESHWEVAGASAGPSVVMDERAYETHAADSAAIGRRSYGNFNPTLQKLHREQHTVKRKKKAQDEPLAEPEEPMGLTAAEMAARYSKYIQSEGGESADHADADADADVADASTTSSSSSSTTTTTKPSSRKRKREDTAS